MNRRRLIDGILYVIVYLCAGFSVLLLLGIIGYVCYRGIGSVNLEFLTTVTSVLKGTVGIAGNIAYNARDRSCLPQNRNDYRGRQKKHH